VEAGDKRWKGPDPPVSSDQQAIQPSELYNGSVNKRGFRAAGIVEALEENLDRPILTANQVAFWQALALSGSSQPIVLGLELPPPPRLPQQCRLTMPTVSIYRDL
jgi:hypothetical protein